MDHNAGILDPSGPRYTLFPLRSCDLVLNSTHPASQTFKRTAEVYMDHTFPRVYARPSTNVRKQFFKLRKMRSNGKSSGVLHHFALQEKSMASVNLTKEWLLR